MTDLQEARARLAAERTQTLRQLADLAHDLDAMVAASRDTNADDEHDPEGATIAFERSQMGALLRQTEHRLAEIDAAVTRVDAGSYGRCESCANPIGEGRLEVRPTARVCIACASSRP
jgi:RNA polymerase-binding protein DksA